VRKVMALLAHQEQALTPHELWVAWNTHPILVLVIGTAVALFLRGWHRGGAGGRGWRHPVGAAGLAALAFALLSPLDALGGALASAHMLQHIILIVVAAPLLVAGGVLATMMLGLPSSVRRAAHRAAWSTGAGPVVRTLRRPGTAWLLHVGALWLWHSAALYEAALGSHWLHGLEHVSFLATALLFWSVALLPQPSPRVFPGVAMLLVFTMALQSVILSALLTFSPTPWYGSYGESARAWGLDPLADQQLAGVMMWVPGGLVYVGIALLLVTAGIRRSAAWQPSAS
jgi:putative membrane protein